MVDGRREVDITAEPKEIAEKAMETIAMAQEQGEDVRIVIPNVTLTGRQAQRFLAVHAALNGAADMSREETLRYLIHLGLEHEAAKMREVVSLVKGAPENAR